MDYFSKDELRLWPLMHGSLTLYENFEKIRELGLKAPMSGEKGLNTFNYDIALGRNDYVFLAPVRITGGYGWGSFLLIDPEIIVKLGVRFSIRDIGELITQIHLYLANCSYNFPEWVIEPKKFENLIISKSQRFRNDV